MPVKTKKPKSKKRNVKKAVAGALNKAQVKAVRVVANQAIHAQIENKTQYFQVSNTLYGSAGGNFLTNNLWPLSPWTGVLNIPQGVGQADRVGNRIKTMRATLKLILLPMQFNAGTNPNPIPMDINVFIFKTKPGSTNLSDVNTIITNDFFQVGNTSSGFGNNLTDLTGVINKDKIILHYWRRFKVGYALANGSGPLAAQQYFANNDYKYNQIINIDITKYIIKNVNFEDAVNTATTSPTFMLVQPVWADNQSIPATTIPAYMTFSVHYEYEDA